MKSDNKDTSGCCGNAAKCAFNTASGRCQAREQYEKRLADEFNKVVEERDENENGLNKYTYPYYIAPELPDYCPELEQSQKPKRKNIFKRTKSKSLNLGRVRTR